MKRSFSHRKRNKCNRLKAYKKARARKANLRRKAED